ncbi:MAG: galactose oxidase-like domain-containing protein [Methylocella sp.]
MPKKIFASIWSALCLSLLLLGLHVPGAAAKPAPRGQWSTVLAPNTNQLLYAPINPIHAALLSNGKVLIVAGSGNCPPSQTGCPTGAPYGPSNGSGAALYDPKFGSFTQFSLSWDMFCNSMVLLPDGRALIVGGTTQYDPFYGQPKTSIFDPSTTPNTFTNVQSMAQGRWYPTVTTLGDGRAMTFSGLDGSGNTTDLVEIYDPAGSGWTQVDCSSPGANCWTPPLYPRMHLLPNGKVFYSGPSAASYLFDPSIKAWSHVTNTNYSWRGYGTSVLLPLTPANNYNPKVMIMGGNNPATATTEIIDLGAANPTWKYGPSMSQARIEMNAVILPTGKVLALGGSKYDESVTSASLKADLYDPAKNTFSSAGANAYARLYHSVALLFPDATVWVAGGNPSRGSYERRMEIYKPAYLFQPNGAPAIQPLISSAPSSISWGSQFTVQSPDAANISSVVLVRNGTVTHAFNTDQRLVGMSFTAGTGVLTITAPPNQNIAPPGYYMFFLVNKTGVPSVASSVRLH